MLTLFNSRKKMLLVRSGDSVKYKQVEFMQDHLGEDFEGIISGVTSWGVFVEIIKTKCEGMVSLKDMGFEWKFDESKMRLVNEQNGKKLHLGHKLMVKIVKTDLARKTIDLDLVNIL